MCWKWFALVSIKTKPTFPPPPPPPPPWGIHNWFIHLFAHHLLHTTSVFLKPRPHRTKGDRNHETNHKPYPRLLSVVHENISEWVLALSPPHTLVIIEQKNDHKYFYLQVLIVVKVDFNLPNHRWISSIRIFPQQNWPVNRPQLFQIGDDYNCNPVSVFLFKFQITTNFIVLHTTSYREDIAKSLFSFLPKISASICYKCELWWDKSSRKLDTF